MKKLFVILAILIMLVGHSHVFGQGQSMSAQTLFEKANRHYKSGEFNLAIENYNSILEQGVSSGAIYYNLGNSYFKDDQIGFALASYERAKQLIPRDGDLIFNDRYVRSRVAGSDPKMNSNIILNLLNGHINFYSVNEMSKIIVLLLIFVAIIFNVSFYWRWSRFSQICSIGLLTLLLIIYSSGLIIKNYFDADRVIIINKAQALFEPREESTMHYQLPEGLIVKLIKKDKEWGKIKRRDGKLGWVQLINIEEI